MESYREQLYYINKALLVNWALSDEFKGPELTTESFPTKGGEKQFQAMKKQDWRLMSRRDGTRAAFGRFFVTTKGKRRGFVGIFDGVAFFRMKNSVLTRALAIDPMRGS